MRCHLATAVTVDTPRAVNPLTSVLRFITHPLSDGLRLSDHLLAGAVASAAAVAALHPMDTLKTVIQKSASTTKPVSAVTSSGAPAATQSLNAFTALLLTLRTGGVSALYKGLSPSLAGQVPAGAIKFAAYETLTQCARSIFPRFGITAMCDYTCAALAFVACSVVLVPGELVKQRLQAGVYGNIGRALTNLVRKEGISTMYTGYGATLLRDVPYTMLEFGLYAQFKRALRAVLSKDSLTAPEELALGGLAGGCTGFLTTPLDLAKTRLMTQGSGAARQYSSVFDVIVKVARSEGLPGLFKGSAARVIWLIPFTAVYFGVHEATKRALRSRKQSASSRSTSTQKLK